MGCDYFADKNGELELSGGYPEEGNYPEGVEITIKVTGLDPEQKVYAEELELPCGWGVTKGLGR
jgi:hypothetical protein